MEHLQLEHLPLNITSEQRSNLKKLADYLLSGKLKAIFNIKTFSAGLFFDIKETTCGTIGCAIGHGPYAGIPKHVDEDWYDYARRVFIGDNTLSYDWLFSSAWYDYDNTPEGTAKRILHTLEHGVPVNHEFNTKIYQ